LFAPTEEQEDLGEFGWAVDISVDGDVAIIGQRETDGALTTHNGRAFIYRLVAGVWTYEETLEYPGSDDYGAGFGWSVAIDGDTAVVGAPWDDHTGTLVGRAWVFERVSEVWKYGQELDPETSEGIGTGDQFGNSVAIDGDFIAVAAHLDNLTGAEDGGSVLLFGRNQGSGWGQIGGKITGASPAADDEFGYSLAIHDDVLAVGAPFRDEAGSNAGAAYIFGPDIDCNRAGRSGRGCCRRTVLRRTASERAWMCLRTPSRSARRGTMLRPMIRGRCMCSRRSHSTPVPTPRRGPRIRS
jgi:hypothetical protein